MADELSSSAISTFLAKEVQNLVDKKTEQLQKINSEQEAQLNELIELLVEEETDCKHRIEAAEALMTQAMNESQEKVKQAKERANHAEEKSKMDESEAKAATQKAQETIEANQAKCEFSSKTQKAKPPH